MKSSWWWRFSFLIIISVFSILMVIPTAFNHKEDSSFPIKSKINLGLDLQGGLYMILGIDFNKVYKDEIAGYGVKIVDYLKDEMELIGKATDVDTTDPRDPKVTITFPAGGDIPKIEQKVKDFFGAVIRLTAESANSVQYGIKDVIKTDIEKQSVQKSIEVIRNRIDEFGVTEPEILSQGRDRIIVQLPGVEDIERAKGLIGKTAKLTFNIVSNEMDAVRLGELIDKAKAQGIEFKRGQRFSEYMAKLNEHLKKDLPEGTMISFERNVNPITNELISEVPYLLDSISKISGEDLQDARVNIDQQKNEPYVGMNFKSRGAKMFEEVTGANVGRQMAIVLDGNVMSAPAINERIAGGRAQINLGSGNFDQTMKEARDLALVLRAGALPVQLDFLEQRIIGPSLGHDSIEKARKASLIGAVLVFLFILMYYRASGALAMVTLTLNVLFVIACLVGFEATLTLPGIAGIALTIGMAVDANIIIYERIREEIRRGEQSFKAVERGFESAFWTIIDANVTTALAGLCLLNFGTGPIKGFAVTLLIGIMATVYSAYFVGNLLYEFYMIKLSGKEVSI